MDAINPAEKVFWIDLRAEGVRVVLGEVARGASVSRGVIVRSERPLTPPEVAALQGEGFAHVSDGRVFDRPGTSFTRNQMQRAFPRAVAIQVPRHATWDRPAPAADPVRAPGRVPAPPAPAAPRPAAPPTAPGTVEPSQARPAARPAAPPRPVLPLRVPPRPMVAPPPPATRQEPQAPERAAPMPAEPAPPRPAPAPPPAPAPRAALPAAAAVEAEMPPCVPEAVIVVADPPREPGRLNAFQAVYAPASKVGKASAAIPVNLAAATRAALDRLEERKGPIDPYVAKLLGWSVERMAEALSPEQVDAVGLALFAAESGQDFVLADMTGFGKGRIVAAIGRAKLLQGIDVVLLTEKENLFSDFYRDIADIGSLDAYGRPFMVNDGAEISRSVRGEREVVHAAWKKSDVTAHLKQGTVPPGTRFTMSSYSQFNKKGSAKTEFLRKRARGAHVLLDESHNAVGDSNTSEAIGDAIEDAASVTHSSATFARGAQNLAAYKRLFPRSMRSSDLMGVLASGGQALSEALSTMLAESGSYLRREHDLSRIRVEVVEDAKRVERNRAYADALSPVLAGVARLARAVNDVVNERNGPEDAPKRKGGKELWTAGNFGSRLSAVMRQFVTCLKVEMCVEECVDALMRGVKPVVVIESTMESLMRELSEDDGPAEDAGGEAEGPKQATDESEAGIEGAGREPPTFRDALRVMVERTLTISVRRPGQPDPEKVPLGEDLPLLRAQADEIKALIDLIPDLTMSPIDDIRARVEGIGRARGRNWVADEISARGLRVVDGKYVPMPARDRNSVVSAFQAGHIDALIITRAASTGLSLHASETVEDRRQRCMIELQIAANVVERMQFFGRVNRRGQVCEPYFRTLSTGLPLESRSLAMQNRKLADLSANVTGAAQSVSAMDVPDIIDAVGNAVCRRFLEERPNLSDHMHIAMRLPDPEKAEAELYHVNKLLQRLCLVNSAEQESTYAQLLKSYEADVRDLTARGGSVGGARELPGEWRVASREVFEAGDQRDGPVFGRPVMLTTIQRSEVRNPFRSEDVTRLVAQGSARMPKVGGEPFAAELKAIRKMQPLILLRSLPQRFASVRVALADGRQNSVKDAEHRISELLTLLSVVRPGSMITVNGEESKENGVVTEVRPPSQEADLATPSMWRISYVVPGGEAVQQISAAGINGDPGTTVFQSDGTVQQRMLDRFDRAPAGETLVTRKILDGNLVRAVIVARHEGWRSAVTWRDGAGTARRAVLVPKSRQHAIATLPGRTTSPEAALAVLNAGGRLRTNRDDPEGGAVIEAVGRSVNVVIPVKKTTAKLFEIPSIMAVTGPWRGAGQKERYAEPALSRAPELLRALAEAGHAFHFDGEYRDEAARAAMAGSGEERNEARGLRP